MPVTIINDATSNIADLLPRAGDGDPRAWEEILRRYSGLVYTKIHSGFLAAVRMGEYGDCAVGLTEGDDVADRVIVDGAVSEVANGTRAVRGDPHLVSQRLRLEYGSAGVGRLDSDGLRSVPGEDTKTYSHQCHCHTRTETLCP